MFETLLIQPILNALLAFHKLFSTIGIAYPFGFAIIALTASIRLAFNPFFAKQVATQKKMAELKPRIDELGVKHKDDKARLQQAQMDLYKEHGVNPMGGCLFAIVQIPIFIGLYQTLNRFVTASSSAADLVKLNKLLYTPLLEVKKLDPNFFIFNLATSPASHKMFEFSLNSGLVLHPQNFSYAPYLLIPVLTGLLQYIQARYTTPAPKPAVESNKKDSKDLTSTKDESKKNQKPTMSDDFQSAMTTQMKYMFPVMIGYFSYTLPLGLSLYWNIFSIFAIIQGIKSKKSTSVMIEEKKS
ncbi:MAG: YidC/Oxa1 family membrane protein insertase [Candidatus Roizmanbacteria bacterium]